jgi:uncharacterized protein YndB with AHSA1/START domain
VNAYAESTPDGWVLVLVRDLRHPPARVWAALTEPDQVSAWAPFTTEHSLAERGELVLRLEDGDQRYDLPSTVLQADPPTLLVYRWGETLLRWELAPTGDGTRLVLRHHVGNRDDMPKAAAGWHLCFQVLHHLLDGDPVPPIRSQDALAHGYQDLHDHYAAQLR